MWLECERCCSCGLALGSTKPKAGSVTVILEKCMSGGLQIGETALHMAAGLGHFEIVVMLLNGGASYGATDKVHPHCTPIIEND